VGFVIVPLRSIFADRIELVGHRSLIQLVSLRPLRPRLGFRILLGVGLAGALRAGRGVRDISKGKVIGAWITRILAAIIRVRPFGRVGVSDRIVQHVVGFRVLSAILRVTSRRLWKSGRRVLLVFLAHAMSLPVASVGKSARRRR
jgi:hypothetical protein